MIKTAQTINPSSNEQTEIFFDKIEQADPFIAFHVLKDLLSGADEGIMATTQFAYFVGKLEGQQKYEGPDCVFPAEYANLVADNAGVLRGTNLKKDDVLGKTLDEINSLLEKVDSSIEKSIGLNYIDGLRFGREIHEHHGGTVN